MGSMGNKETTDRNEEEKYEKNQKLTSWMTLALLIGILPFFPPPSAAAAINLAKSNSSDITSVHVYFPIDALLSTSLLPGWSLSPPGGNWPSYLSSIWDWVGLIHLLPCFALR